MHVSDLITINADEAEIKTALSSVHHASEDINVTLQAIADYTNDISPVVCNRFTPFSSETKWSGGEFADGKTYIIGAAEFVFSDKEKYREVFDRISEISDTVRIIALVKSDRPIDGLKLPDDLSPMALVLIKDTMRENVNQTVDYFKEQGVTLKVISGDSVQTVRNIAKETGIEGADRAVDMTEIKTDEQLDEAAEKYNIFGRVTPAQKKKLVLALKAHGHSVAMTGDGVNDVLALKDADCSIAMASGSAAASNVSDLVLLDSNFASMPHVVAEGRRVINNIERSASLFIVKNIFSFFMTIIALISMSLYPFKPSQLSLVSAAMIGIPSFILALEPNTNLVKGRFMRNVLFRAFPIAITAIIMVCWEMLFASAFSSYIDSGLSSTIAFFIYTVISYIMLFNTCRPMTLIHKILFVSMGVLVFAAVLVAPNLFALVPLTSGALLVLVTLTVISVPLSYLCRKLFDNLGIWKVRIREYLKKDLEQSNPPETEDNSQ
jgi:cation-transporting ATPase E